MKLNDIDIWLTNFLMSIGIWGYVLSCFLILIESIIPVLPLSVFITLLFYKFGPFIGFIISYVFTILGCIMSYKLFNSKLRDTVIQSFDTRSYVFRNLITFKRFQNEIMILKPRKA